MLSQQKRHTDSDGVTVLDSESGRAVSSEVLVSFLVSLVFGDAT
jgi:hypothetical protein